MSVNVFLPVFPGTNCEYESKLVFEREGASVNDVLFNNLNSDNIGQSIDAFANAIKKAQIIMLPGGFSAADEPNGSAKLISAVLRNPKIKDELHKFLHEKQGLMLGICNGFQALVKTGLIPAGKVLEPEIPASAGMTQVKHPEIATPAASRNDDTGETTPSLRATPSKEGEFYPTENGGTISCTLTNNVSGLHIAKVVSTRIVNNDSPWLTHTEIGQIHKIPISHGEGRFVASPETLQLLESNNQIATVYEGENPNGSTNAIEGLLALDGRILGKMGHSERSSLVQPKNIEGNVDQGLFKSALEYWK
jgi:phosphoribosylformylglycinamidine synthase